MTTKKSKDIEAQIESKTKELCALLKEDGWNRAEWAIREIAVQFGDNYYETIGILTEAAMSLKKMWDEKAEADMAEKDDDDDEESGQPPAPDEAGYVCPECAADIARRRRAKPEADDDAMSMAG